MKRLILVFSIGFMINVMFVGCDSLTQKSKLYDMLYDSFIEGRGKVTPDKANCMAEKVIAKLSDKEIDTLTKALELLDGGYEREVMSSEEYILAIGTAAEYEQGAFFECK
ncbi:MAG: hypothetical protein QG565_656 [Campylobacterota bacterium]|nr:hypothetical protein [Campylobacterota bacterium]